MGLHQTFYLGADNLACCSPPCCSRARGPLRAIWRNCGSACSKRLASELLVRAMVG